MNSTNQGPANTKSGQFASTRLLARNATLNLVTEGLIFLFLIVAIPKLVSFLGETAFGLFSIAWVAVGYLAFLDIGVSSATTKFTSEYLAKQEKDRIGDLIRTALAANTIMGVVAGGVAVSISPLLIRYVFKIPESMHSQALSVFVGVAFALPVLLIQGVLRAVLTSYQRFDWLNLVNGSVISLQWVVMTLLAWRGFGVVTVVWVAVLARVVMVAVFAFLLLRLVPDVFSQFSFCWATLWRLLHFGAWVSVSQVMSPILVYLDRIMIAAMVSLQAVTIYTIPTEVFNRLGILPSCLMATLFPAFSHHGAIGAENGQMTRLYNVTTRYLLFVLLPFFALLFVNAQDILTVWMGPKFSTEGTLVLQILAVGALVNFIARLPYGAVQAVGRPDITGKFHLLELPIYLALCLLLIPRWGIEGAALACTARLLLDAFLMFWAANKYCHLRPKWIGETGRLLMIEVFLLVCLLTARHILHEVWGRLTLGVVLLGMAYAAIWFFALNGEDKPAIVRTIRFARQEAGQ
jgi:O-antigen/teichoic acid export membrane protein